MNTSITFLPKCSEQIFYTRPSRFEYRGHTFEAEVYADVHDSGAHIEPVFFHVLKDTRVELRLIDFVQDERQQEGFYMEFLEYFWGGVALSESWFEVMHSLLDTCLTSKRSLTPD